MSNYDSSKRRSILDIAEERVVGDIVIPEIFSFREIRILKGLALGLEYQDLIDNYGIQEGQIHKCLKDRNFQHYLGLLRRQNNQFAMVRARNLLSEAFIESIEKTVEIMRSENAGNRDKLNSAKMIIDLTVKLYENDQSVRIDQLEHNVEDLISQLEKISKSFEESESK